MTHEQVLLQQAASEIKQLRESNKKMIERLYMFDSMMLLVRGREGGASGVAYPDLVYEIEKHLENSKP